LYQIASILKVDFNYFFEGFPHSTPSTESNSQTIIRTDPEKPLKVLLIDDNEEDTYLTKKAFDASSIPVTLSSMNDGTESLRFLRNQTTHQSRPDVILLNLHLPKVHGLTILHELKQDDTLSDIPVIILSGSTNKNDISTCYQKYASGYMCKLFDFNLFKTNVQNFTRYWAQTVVLPNR
jgi:two-component system, chemotaxis family, response regulator Rcp1